LISDGSANYFPYNYKKHNEDDDSKAKYFIYLPTSHDFDLQINAKLKSFSVDSGTIEKNKWSGGNEKRPVLDKNFFNFKVSVKKLALL